MIVGAGQVGCFLCEKLSIEGQEVVLIDRDESKLRRIEQELNIMTVHGSGASAKVLEEAGIDKTDLFIAVTDSDEVNLVACIMSKQFEVKTRIARVRNEDFYHQGKALTKKTLGIDLLISPDLAMAEEIFQLSTRSSAFEVAEFADGQVVLAGYVLHEGNKTVGRSLQDMHDFPGVMVSIVRGDNTIIPRGNDVIQAEDKVYLVARKEDSRAVESFLNIASRQVRRVFIIGGGTIGYLVARRMEQNRMGVRVVEKDLERCKFLTQHLENSVVLNCDGLDSHALMDEGIDRADLVVAVTNTDTKNILTSLMAKHYGAKKCITHLKKADFIPMLDELGIDMALSPRLVAANMILQFVRAGGTTVSVATLMGSNAEVVELKVPDKKRFKDVPLKSLHFPKGAIVGAIVREEKVIIPKGDTILKVNDNLVIFFSRDALPAVEEFFE